MLVLSRKPGERIVVGKGIVVTVLRVRKGQVRLGIDAPPGIGIIREELLAGQESSHDPAVLPSARC